MSESKSQDPKGESSNDVFSIDDGNTTLSFSTDGTLNPSPFSPQETFINPPTYSHEEAQRCIQQAIDQFWADDLAAQQDDVSANMQNHFQGQTFVGQAALDASAPEQTGSSDHQLDLSTYLLSNAQFPVDFNICNGQDQKAGSTSSDSTVSDPEMDGSAVVGFPPHVPRIPNGQTNRTTKPENPVTETPTPTNLAPAIQNRQQATTPAAANTSVRKSLPSPSATPDVKPIPQARTRGVKRAREPTPSPREAKRPAGRNGRLATKKAKPEESDEAEPRAYRLLAPKAPEPYQQQALHANMLRGAGFQHLNDPASVAANGEVFCSLDQQCNHRLQLAQMGMPPQRPAPMRPPQQAQMGINPHGIPSSYNGNMPCSSPMLLQQQARMGMNPRVIPSSHNRNIHCSSPVLLQQQAWMGLPRAIPSSHNGDITWSPHMVPQQQRANGVAMGSMGHHQFRGNGIPRMNPNGLLDSSMEHHQLRSNSISIPMGNQNGLPDSSMDHHQLRGNGIPIVNPNGLPNSSMGHPRVNGNVMMNQNNGPMVNAPSSMWYRQVARELEALEEDAKKHR